jgi:hypothetical protein
MVMEYLLTVVFSILPFCAPIYPVSLIAEISKEAKEEEGPTQGSGNYIRLNYRYEALRGLICLLEGHYLYAVIK